MASERGTRRVVTGTVVSDKMDKKITVRQDRIVKHTRYGKYIRRATKYKAHDENNQAKLGDTVEITFCRPLSKSKTWRLVSVIKAGQGAQ